MKNEERSVFAKRYRWHTFFFIALWIRAEQLNMNLYPCALYPGYIWIYVTAWTFIDLIFEIVSLYPAKNTKDLALFVNDIFDIAISSKFKLLNLMRSIKKLGEIYCSIGDRRNLRIRLRSIAQSYHMHIPIKLAEPKEFNCVSQTHRAIREAKFALDFFFSYSRSLRCFFLDPVETEHTPPKIRDDAVTRGDRSTTWESEIKIVTD